MAKPPFHAGQFAGNIRFQSGYGAAGRAEKRKRRETRSDVLPMLMHGVELQKRGSFGLAAEAYHTILERDPDNPDALHLLGTLAMTAGEVDAAVGYFKRAATGKPADPMIRVNLANALLERDETADAEFHLRKALKLQPELPSALCFLAACKAANGDFEGAKEIYQKVVARAPDLPQALIGYGDLCQILGDLETARALYRRAISCAAAPATALAGLATCEKLEKDSPEAQQIMAHLRRPGLRPVDYVNLSYAAAGIADGAGDYDEAFSHYLHAKTLSAARFDMEAHRAEIRAFKTLFTKEFFQDRAKYGHPSALPIFVVGMPRSGTTLTEQIISRHPDAAGAGELRDVGRMVLSLGLSDENTKDYVRRVTKLTPRETRDLAERYLARLQSVSATARRVTDKMPQNFLHLGLMAMLFPKAKIVHCRRNPLDTCLSCFTIHLKDHGHGYTGDLATLGLYYREYADLMAHWRGVLHQPIYDLDYERLVDNPEDEARRLIEFVGLPWDPACLSPHESQRPIRTLSRIQVRQPVYRSSIARWRRYDRHLGPLKDALGDLITDTGSAPSSHA